MHIEMPKSALHAYFVVFAISGGICDRSPSLVTEIKSDKSDNFLALFCRFKAMIHGPVYFSCQYSILKFKHLCTTVTKIV
jgi:hypothetical protein